MTALLVSAVKPPEFMPLGVAASTAVTSRGERIAEALSWEDSPVAVTCNVVPRNCSEEMYQLVSNSPFLSATTFHGWNELGAADTSTTIKLTVSPGWKPVPWK